MLLADLIASKVDVIVTHGTPGALAAKQATTTIPIVVAVVGDALSSGWAGRSTTCALSHIRPLPVC